MTQTPTITVKGTGRASLPADTVVLNLKNSAIDFEYEDSMQIVNERVEHVRSGMEKMGFERNMVKTSDFRIHRTEKKVNGYLLATKQDIIYALNSPSTTPG